MAMIKCQQKMIHSILIIGGDLEERLGKGLQLAESFLGKTATNHPDLFFLKEAQSLKIAQVRELQHQLALKPYSAPFKVALINEADKLTLPAQHALLKTLEEPPEKSIIILTVPNKETLLPTIISRCQIIQIPVTTKRLEPSFLTSHLSLLTQILSSSPGQRLLMAEKYAQDRQQATEFCQNQLIISREILRQKILSLPISHFPSLISHLSLLTPTQIVHLLHQIQQSLVLLKANINPHLVVDNLLLSYPF